MMRSPHPLPSHLLKHKQKAKETHNTSHEVSTPSQSLRCPALIPRPPVPSAPSSHPLLPSILFPCRWLTFSSGPPPKLFAVQTRLTFPCGYRHPRCADRRFFFPRSQPALHLWPLYWRGLHRGLLGDSRQPCATPLTRNRRSARTAKFSRRHPWPHQRNACRTLPKSIQ
jgi:hypothetical protein